MNIIRIIYSGGIRMGTFQLIQDLEFGNDYFWIQIPPNDDEIYLVLNKSMWYYYAVGESNRYIFTKKDLDLPEV